MATTDPARLVFIDECSTHASMTRRRARAARGVRARGAVPRNRGAVTTLITGLALSGMSPAMTVEGGTTAAVFAAYLQQVLLPSLRPRQVVVVDNVVHTSPAPHEIGRGQARKDSQPVAGGVPTGRVWSRSRTAGSCASNQATS
ncbi:hypothetical protein JOD57_003573 [Geodermatophilus bullaregiensis]|nr:hypothetical protein [Geodermatophilus bullaregiensis]